MTSRYRPIKPIDALIIQLLSPEVIPEPEQKATNNILLLAINSIIPTYELKSSDRRTEEYPKTPIAGVITKSPSKKEKKNTEST
jgi:hypothetical protein